MKRQGHSNTGAIALFLLLSIVCSAQNPSLVKNINPSTDESVKLMLHCDVLNGILYFNGDDGTGKELWRTDGTAAGTWQVKDICAVPTTNPVIYGGPYALNGKLYFQADDGVNGRDPWVSDGT